MPQWPTKKSHPTALPPGAGQTSHVATPIGRLDKHSERPILALCAWSQANPLVSAVTGGPVTAYSCSAGRSRADSPVTSCRFSPAPADSITSERRLRSNGREAHPALCEEDYEILFPFIAFTICTGGDRLLQLPYMIYLLCAKVKGRKQSNPTNTHSLSVRTYKQPWVRAFACTSPGREW